jgi:hydrogenase/urease accessory protein HupE
MKRLLLRALLVPWMWWAVNAAAHEIRPAVVTVTFTTPTYRIDVNTNVEALLAGIGPAHADTNESPDAKRYDELRALPPAALKARLQKFAPDLLKGMGVEFDGERIEPVIAVVDVPAVGDLKVARISTITLEGRMPNNAREFRWSYAREFGDSVLKLRETGREGEANVWLRGGDWSDPYVFGKGLSPRTKLQVAGQYLTLGFTHILPYGLDHILFVLGLFLLSTRWKPLLIQVTAFTIAHSITLALTIYGVFSLPSSVVEPLIALSIAYVAIENMLTKDLHAWRPLVVFGFGLLHGMGFAGVLQEIGMPRSEFVAALISFNVGVELGQLAVITLAFLTAGLWFQDKPWYRARIVVPASLVIAVIGFYWTVERVTG